jgi:hypothetical protein
MDEDKEKRERNAIMRYYWYTHPSFLSLSVTNPTTPARSRVRGSETSPLYMPTHVAYPVSWIWQEGIRPPYKSRGRGHLRKSPGPSSRIHGAAVLSGMDPSLTSGKRRGWRAHEILGLQPEWNKKAARQCYVKGLH